VRPKESCLLWAADLTIPLRAIGIGYNWFSLSRALREKRPKYEQRYDKVILLHDNTRPHVTKVVKKYLETLKWDVLPHPPYSPDIASSDYWSKDAASYRFFRRNRKLAPKFASKDESFFRDGIRKLPESWEKVGSDGQYFNWSVHSFCFEINAFLNGPN